MGWVHPAHAARVVGSRLPRWSDLRRANLHIYQTVGLLFFSMGIGSFLRLCILHNSFDSLSEAAKLIATALITILYTYGGMRTFYNESVDRLFFEITAMVTLTVIVYYDVDSNGQLDIWWLLLLVHDAMFLCDVRVHVWVYTTVLSVVYMLFCVVSLAAAWTPYAPPDWQARGWLWGLTLGCIRSSAFFGNMFIVRGIVSGKGRIVELVGEVSADLAVFDLDAAEATLVTQRATATVRSLRQLAHNLRRYKPYLPPEVLVGDPEHSGFVTQTLAVAKVRFPALRPDLKDKILTATFRHAKIRGGWCHTFDSSSATLIFGAERLKQSHLEGIWGVGAFYIIIVAAAGGDGGDGEDGGGGNGTSDAAASKRPSYVVHVLGTRRQLAESSPLVEVGGGSGSGSARNAPPHPFPLDPPVECSDARYYADLGGAVLWFGEGDALEVLPAAAATADGASRATPAEDLVNTPTPTLQLQLPPAARGDGAGGGGGSSDVAPPTAAGTDDASFPLVLQDQLVQDAGGGGGGGAPPGATTNASIATRKTLHNDSSISIDPPRKRGGSSKVTAMSPRRLSHSWSGRVSQANNSGLTLGRPGAAALSMGQRPKVVPLPSGDCPRVLFTDGGNTKNPVIVAGKKGDGKTLEVFVQVRGAAAAGIPKPNAHADEDPNPVPSHAPSSDIRALGSRKLVLSRQHGVTNVACEAALAIQEAVQLETETTAEVVVVLDDCEIGVVGDEQRKTLSIQGSGVDRVEELFDLLREVPGIAPSWDYGKREKAKAEKVAVSGGDGASDNPRGGGGARATLICNHRAAEYLHDTHGVCEVHAGPPDDGPMFAFGDKNRFGKLEREEIRLQSQLPADRLIDLAELTPDATWVKIGEGKTGVVYLSRYIRLSKDVAVKKLHDNATPVERVMFLNELLAMNKVRWDTVCNFFGYAKGPHGAVFLIMEYCDKGPLSGLIYNTDLSDAERAACARDAGASISQALTYIHNKRMVHMDVASRNVLVTADGQYRLADLGFLTPVGERSKVICFPWAPPEAVRSFPDVDASFAYDIWSFGMLLYEILAGAPPFGPRPRVEAIKATLAAGRLPHPPPCVQRDVACEKLWREMVLPCLAHTPLSRPGMTQLACLFDKTFTTRAQTASMSLNASGFGKSSSPLQRSPRCAGAGAGAGGSRGELLPHQASSGCGSGNPHGSATLSQGSSPATLNPYASTDVYGSTNMYGSTEVDGAVPLDDGGDEPIAYEKVVSGHSGENRGMNASGDPAVPRTTSGATAARASPLSPPRARGERGAVGAVSADSSPDAFPAPPRSSLVVRRLPPAPPRGPPGGAGGVTSRPKVLGGSADSLMDDTDNPHVELLS